MPKRAATAACLAIAIGLAHSAFQADVRSEPTDPSPNDVQVARGRYLVHDVAQCIQCHTPRDDQGRLRRDRLLRGAPIPVRPDDPEADWAFAAPSIVGLTNYDADLVRHILQHGERPDGYRPKRPMPTFRLDDEDVAGVIAYLKSLSP